MSDLFFTIQQKYPFPETFSPYNTPVSFDETLPKKKKVIPQLLSSEYVQDGDIVERGDGWYKVFRYEGDQDEDPRIDKFSSTGLEVPNNDYDKEMKDYKRLLKDHTEMVNEWEENKKIWDSLVEAEERAEYERLKKKFKK